MSEDNAAKVFVGNVPFDCSSEEFTECFASLEGFKEANIIKRTRSDNSRGYPSNLSRGFGFVVFESPEQADKLLQRTDMRIKDRDLRFSHYNKEQNGERVHKFKGVLRNLDPDWNEETIRNTFIDFSTEVVIKNMASGGRLALVSFNNRDDLRKALSMCYKIGDVDVQLLPDRRRRPPHNDTSNFMARYDMGFRAGYNAGLSVANQRRLPRNRY